MYFVFLCFYKNEINIKKKKKKVNGDYMTKAFLLNGLKYYPIFSVIFSENIIEVCIQK